MTDLSLRVLNAVGAASHEMTAILGLLRIEETESVRTASVSCERRPVLRINPAFVREHCRTDEHLFMLVMHELHHVLLGHTRLFPRATLAHNLAFDAVINALLVRRFPAGAYTSFFLDLYRGQDGPMRLLAPPACDRITDPALHDLHRVLYESDRVTSEEVFTLVVEAAGAAEDADDGGLLLGEHGADDDGWGTDGPVDAAFIRAVRSIVEKWPPPEHPLRGRSLADVLEDETVRPSRTPRRVLAAVRDALLGAGSRRIPGGARQPRLAAVQSPLPTPADRRAAVVRQAGLDPLLYARLAPDPRGRPLGRARVYLDVSGSMDEYLPFLYHALSALREHVEPRVFLFSTVVRPIPLADLARGAVRTTAGTDIACVVRHVLRERVRTVLLVTDGYVGRVPAAARAALMAKTQMRVALTPCGWRDDLEDVAARITELPELEEGS